MERWEHRKRLNFTRVLWYIVTFRANFEKNGFKLLLLGGNKNELYESLKINDHWHNTKKIHLNAENLLHWLDTHVKIRNHTKRTYRSIFLGWTYYLLVFPSRQGLASKMADPCDLLLLLPFKRQVSKFHDVLISSF